MGKNYFEDLFEKAFVYIHYDENVESCIFRASCWLKEANELYSSSQWMSSYILYLRVFKLVYIIPQRFRISKNASYYNDLLQIQKNTIQLTERLTTLQKRIAVMHAFTPIELSHVLQLANHHDPSTIFLNIYAHNSSKEYSFSSGTVFLDASFIQNNSLDAIRTVIKTPHQAHIKTAICYSCDNMLDDANIASKIYLSLLAMGITPRFLDLNSPAKVGKNTISISPVGLTNLGNSCYMNSILQCCFACSPFVSLFIDGQALRSLNQNNPLGTGGKLTTAFTSLSHQVRALQGQGVCSPKDFLANVCSIYSEFDTASQHDAQEFLNFFLDSLHEDLNSSAGKAPLPELTTEQQAAKERLPMSHLANIEWNIYKRRNSSPIADLFFGQLASQIKCLTCQRTSTTFAPFSSLALPIKDTTTSCTLETCISAFSMQEVLQGNNAWHCPKCDVPRDAKKTMSVSRLPSVLIFQLKRFRMIGTTHRKIETSLEFKKRISSGMIVPPSFQSSIYYEPVDYELFAFVNHYGDLENGHYTATVFHNYDWYYCDDAIVQPVTDFKRIYQNFSTAYILFYQKVDAAN
ncbi:ubiquitin carboxy terminal hydrolase Ubp4 [Schizosaccharomyces japonicus yFS275]|uniref:Ubiquitin carboxyl-terminal hydrolase n=1 Tax=Schizosaccharomyces japonicus (strain yFS275 / FY16936) TaxID=402676 RepID=B6K476_SCHJY|nr:ubiquitin carboxy terminal hydrolase Ubp4 [Schizosaccharomyces japonicus yFS275]EEB08283.2 ubiquitin carboxy terminal hydrolase Ubp4 [Schizosaccharomyces japonicus yFS275]